MKYASMLLVVLSAAVAGGCTSLEVSERLIPPPDEWKLNPWDDGIETPDEIVAVWSSALRRQKGEEYVRGFAGRIHCYKKGERKPVKIDGRIIVYAFIERDREAFDARPDRIFLFERDQLEYYYSESKLGHSYTLWLPWGDVDGPQEEISLIVKIEPFDGSTVQGGMATQILPGKAPVGFEGQLPEVETHLKERIPREPIRRASFEAAVDMPGAEADTPRHDVGDVEHRRMRTSTIRLPSRYGVRQLETSTR